MAQCMALENNFSGTESRIDRLDATNAAANSKLTSLVEDQQAVISAVTFLINKMDTIVSH